MKEKELLSDTKRKEIVDDILEYFSKRIKENKTSHLEAFADELQILDRIITQYLLLSYIIKDSDKNKFSGRSLFSTHHINTIANNFYSIKELFISGYHIQLQIMIRSQFEFVNNVIAFIGDDEYFKRYGMYNREKKHSFITPKPNHAEKSIKRILKDLISSKYKFNDFWKLYKEMMNSLYTDLSETVHGNIVKIAFQSLDENENNSEIVMQNLCGVKKPIPRIVYIK